MSVSPHMLYIIPSESVGSPRLGASITISQLTGTITDSAMIGGVILFNVIIYNPTNTPQQCYFTYTTPLNLTPVRVPVSGYITVAPATFTPAQSYTYVITTSDVTLGSVPTMVILYSIGDNVMDTSSLSVNILLVQIYRTSIPPMVYYTGTLIAGRIEYDYTCINKAPATQSYYITNVVNTLSTRNPSTGYSTLASGLTALGTVYYVLQETDIYVVDSVITVWCQQTPNDIITDQATYEVTLPAASTINFVVNSYVGTIVQPIAVGSLVKYTATVSVSGYVPVFHINVNDSLTTNLWTPSDFQLPYPNTWVMTHSVTNNTYMLRQVDFDIGYISSTAYLYQGDPTVISNLKDTIMTAVVVKPIKIQNYLGILSGNTINYTINIYNNWLYSITNIIVTDNLSPAWSFTIPNLNSTSAINIPRVYQVTSADLLRGYVNSTVTTTVTYAWQGPAITYIDQATTQVTINPIAITSYTGYPDTGTVMAGVYVNYTTIVQNKLPSPVANVSISSTPAITWTPTVFGLSGNGSQSCIAPYLITTTDINNTVINSQVSVSVTVSGHLFTISAALSVWTRPIQIIDYNGFAESLPIVVGTKIHYIAQIRNNTTHTLTMINLVDTRIAWATTIPTIVGNTTVTMTYDYSITQNDIDIGIKSITSTLNTSITQTTPLVDGALYIPPQTDSWTYVDAMTITVQLKYLTITEYTGTLPSGLTLPGTVVNYIVKVKNNVQFDLPNVSVSDSGDVEPTTWSTIIPLLSASSIVTLTRDPYYVTQNNINKGSINSTMTATVTVGTVTDDAYRSTAVTITQVPSLSMVVYTGVITATVVVGTPVMYTYTFQNTGNMTATEVVVTDTLGYRYPAMGTIQLDPTQSITTTDSNYHITLADILAGQIISTATINGIVNILEVDVPITDSLQETVYIGAPPSLLINQYSPPAIRPDLVLPNDPGPPPIVGTIFRYTYQVTNTGNYDLENVVVIDDKGNGNISTINIGTLPKNTSPVSLYDDYPVQQIDILLAGIASKVHAEGIYSGDLITSASVSAFVPIEQISGILLATYTSTIKNTDSYGDIILGQSYVEYTFTIENTGNLPLKQIMFYDILGNIVNVAPSLKPTLETQGSCQYTILESDILYGAVETVGITLAQSYVGTIDSQKYNSISLGAPPNIALVSYEGTITAPKVVVGTPVTYTYTIHNTVGHRLSNPIFISSIQYMIYF